MLYLYVLRHVFTYALAVCIQVCIHTCLLYVMVFSGTREDWLLFPVLARMEFDTKERTKFFGLSRERACGIGSGPRKSCSALRPCTPHSDTSAREDLDRLRMIDEVGKLSDLENSLKRRGLHPHLTCTALTGKRPSLIRWSGRIYCGLFAYDVLHCLYLNCIGYLHILFFNCFILKNESLTLKALEFHKKLILSKI